MNRFLVVPGLLTVACFACVYVSSSNDTTANTNEPLVATINSSPTIDFESSKRVMMTDEQVREWLMEGWPTLSLRQLASRAMPRQPFYARLNEFAANGSDDSCYLTSIFVHARPEQKLTKNKASTPSVNVQSQNTSFPLHIDRYTGQTLVFAEYKWQSYSDWRRAKMPEFEKLTGWSVNR